MIEGLKPYTEYRDSNSPWFGHVPSHWDVKRLGSLFGERGETNERREVTDILSVLKDRGVIPYAEKGRIGNKASDDIGRYKIVRPDDLVVNCMNVIIGSLGRSRYTGCLSPVYYVLRRRNPQNHPRYLELLFQHRPFHQSLIRIGNGILAHRMRIPMEKLKAEMLPLPPPDEQVAIVRFLDHANRKIDGFIRSKRKLIALLGEQKQAIIHRAVTRGLNPNAPLKPSGIPWLGEIPQHWEVRRLRTLVYRIEQGISPQATGFLAEGDSWGVLKSGCVNYGVFRQTEHKQLAKGFKVDPTIAVKVGDVLISRACGSPKLVGSVGKVDSLNYNLILSDKTFRAIFRPLVNVEFMVYAMNCSYYRQQVEQAISGAEGMANNLPLSELRSFVFAIPPLDEAAATALSLEKELAQFTAAIARTEREIALIQEYRTRLTADVVTGKLDVREAAAKLPDSPVDHAQPEDADPGLEPDADDAEYSELEREN